MVLQVPEVDRTPAQAVPGLILRLLQASDVEALGELMWEAYRGTVDDEYKEPDDARVDAAQALAGRWGPLIDEASLAATADGRLIAAVVTVRDDAHNMIPLLAYVLTAPAWQRRGVAAWLVAESAVRLAALDIPEVHLAVTRGNPAERVYERLGFRVVD